MAAASPVADAPPPAPTAGASPTRPPSPSPVRPTPTAASRATPTTATAWAELVVVWENDLWLTSTDGTRMRRLTDDGGYSKPVWSPDGSRIAFVHGEGKEAEIGTVAVDGADKRMLTKNVAADTEPAWSPRGDTLAFTRTADTNGDGAIDLRDESEIWLVDADGRNERRLVAGREPAWSPEGLRLAFATNGVVGTTSPYRRENAINMVNAKGENEWTVVSTAKIPTEIEVDGFILSPATTLLKSPAWSPDGARLSFATSGHTGLLCTISTRATDLRVLDSSYEGGFGRSAWSPRGDRLAYEAFPPTGLNEVVVADATGKRLCSLGGVRASTSVVEPAWSPDGRRLAYAQLEAEPYVGLVAAEGGNPIPLLWGRARWPQWSPR